MKVSVVCGLNFGDEGKGMVTSSLCLNSENSLVVRYGGGHQCGHTVFDGEKQHIFSNFGSGTLYGHPTYISRYCTIDPYGIMNEYNILKQKNINSPVLMIDPMAMVTIPYDIFQNRDMEKRLQHGSCGVGFGQTVERNDIRHYKIFANDLLYPWILKEKIEAYKKRWCDNYNESILYFYEAVEWLLSNENIYISIPNLNDFDNVVFEGHQGTMLDMDFGIFPHVTRSNTTVKNALELINELRLPGPEIYYVTRAYLTRHGNGAIPFEDISVRLKNTHMETNHENMFQGKFRIAPFNIDLLEHAVKCNYNIGAKGISSNLVITCCDQIDGNWKYIQNNKLHTNDEVFISRVHFNVPFEGVYKSFTDKTEIL